LATLLLGGTSLLLLLATLVAYIRVHWWWIRAFEFPRLQLALLALSCALASLLWLDPGPWRNASVTLSLVSAIIQFCYIFPWTPLWPVQVKRSAQEAAETHKVTLLIANVLTSNRQSRGLLEMIAHHQPDIVLTLESDHWWQNQLDKALEKSWPYAVKIPLDNLYGMHLYSSLQLKNTEVRWLIQDDIPSIHTQLELASGETVQFYAVHPRPPAPNESEKSLWRDAELLWVGKEIHEHGQASIVAGDLNDVAWSRTTRLFCRVSSMLDPRRGRGMFSTFHAHYPVLRWPLDHVFVSEHFTLVKMQRLDKFGSDHFPILTTLCYRPSRQAENEEPDANGEEHLEAHQTIQQGKQEEQQS